MTELDYQRKTTGVVHLIYISLCELRTPSAVIIWFSGSIQADSPTCTYIEGGTTGATRNDLVLFKSSLAAL